MSEKSFGESGRLPDSEDFHKVGEMTMDARHEVTAYTSRRRRKKRWRSAVMALAAVVVFCTTYALILPAITMAQQTYCGMEEHRHGDDCYETVLLCDKEFDVVQPEGHIHTATCCDYEEVLTCGLEECEDTLHEHTDDCYDEEGNLVCTQPEVIEGHTHTEDCYGEKEVLICGEEEQQDEQVGGPDHLRSSISLLPIQFRLSVMLKNQAVARAGISARTVRFSRSSAAGAVCQRRPVQSPASSV